MNFFEKIKYLSVFVWEVIIIIEVKFLSKEMDSELVFAEVQQVIGKTGKLKCHI